MHFDINLRHSLIFSAGLGAAVFLSYFGPLDKASAQAVNQPTVNTTNIPKTELDTKPTQQEPPAKQVAPPTNIAVPAQSSKTATAPSQNTKELNDKSVTFKSLNALELAEQYYSASDLETMDLALKTIKKSWPNHPLRWELESVHAQLMKDTAHVSLAALNALEAYMNDYQSSAHEAWPLIPKALYTWPSEAQVDFTHRLHQLIQGYPNQPLQASMAWSARHIAHFSGDKLGFARSSERIGQLLPLNIIGTWDNDQGKGLDIPYPPEKEFNSTAQYQGKLTQIQWRSDYPKDLRGKINFNELLSPTRWQIAYGANVISVREAGDATLRISTTDPIKVWINESLVFTSARINGWLFDGISLPVKFHKGANSILIKSAQQTGGWMLTARVTKTNGAPLVYEVKSLDTPIPPVQSTIPPILDESFITQQFQSRFSAEAPARRDFHTLHLLEESGLKVERLKYSEQVAQRFPNSIWLKVSRATALWENGELGQAADIIAQLFKLVKDKAQAPYLIELQTRFWSQQRLDVKARKVARELLEKRPKDAFSYTLLSNMLKDKGWHEESCMLLYKAERLDPSDRRIQSKLAKCEKNIARHARSNIRYQRIWSHYPKLTTTFEEQYRKARLARDTSTMIAIGEECVKAWPQRSQCYLLLARGLWDAERTVEALNTLNALNMLNPLSSLAYKQRGEWLIVLGDQEGAIKSWEKAIELDPDDQNLILRLGELKPQNLEPWLKDVPSDERIRDIINNRTQMMAAEGANQAYLLDDEITLLKPDGSTESVVTQIIHAFNQEGRDDLTKMYIGRGRRTQLMAAYAISPDGTRVEASSIRKGVVRFRQLKIGSTVVIQYRNSESPSSYLVGHITKSWWFQNLDTQVLDSRWVFWMPKDKELKELARKANALEAVKPLERTEEIYQDQKRVMWRMTNLPPVAAEPRMPPIFGQVAGLQISTVPSWAEVFKWERELLRDAFRVSPEVEELSKTLFSQKMTTEDRFYAIQDYVTRNIRYQQDYEHTIAGVKPHTAAQVLARQYGDCKDKAVLFITLAKTVGLKADFALVRTRNSGTVEKEIPSQQFNHAIVYVPAQEGFPNGRFFDPTVDALDVQSLRSDDQGTKSLVYNPIKDRHYWQDIPFQDPSFDESEDIVNLTVDETGKVTGELKMRSRGKIGQIIRQRARNPENFKQVMQYRVNQLLPGAQMRDHKPIQVDDLYTPAEALIKFEHDSWVNREGNQLRLPSIVDWSPKSSFQLEDRRFPLVLGHKRQWRWTLNAQLPHQFDLSHLPKDRKVGSECLSIERRSEWLPKEKRLHIEWTYLTLCEQLSPKEYQAHRPLARDMLQLLNEEIVLSPQPNLHKQ
jgi:tetratricopeptide (TPR) repeat protein